MSLKENINKNLETIAESKSAEQVEQAIDSLDKLKLSQQLNKSSLERFKGALGNCLLMFLDEPNAHPRYRNWLATYFGQVEARFADSRQQPKYMYYPELEPKPWFDESDFKSLEKNKTQREKTIRELTELINEGAGFEAYVKGEMKDDAWSTLVNSDDWGALPLVNGEGKSKVLGRLPETDSLIKSLPLAELSPMAPEVFLSRLKPGVCLPPHYGLSNLKVTAHLPVILPESEKLSITVGDETRTWRANEWLIFDDSFLHSARNDSGEERIVLICDFWNPLLTEEEQSRLTLAIKVIEKANSLFRSW